jgi:phage shock protein PspC (stress-responsive transcriptional regulator)
MRKVTTINLNHNAYQIDEDGYEKLRQYLEDAERALAGNPDRAEIMADLEQAIADKIRVALGQFKTVVSAAEIERILKEMGPVVSNDQGPQQSADGDATSGAGAHAGPRPRRLYRIEDGRQWAGVCTGVAAYAGVDVTWVRVAFILLTILTTGFFLIIYLVLAFAMPIAATPEEISAAHGQPFNAQELVDRVKNKHEEFRAERRSRWRAKRNGQWFAAEPAPASSVPRQPPGPAARVAGGVMLPVFTVLSAGWFALMAVAAIMVWHTLGEPGFIWQYDHQHVHLPRWVPLVAVFAIYALLALPIGAARKTALYYANGGRAHGWADAWSGVLWIGLVTIVLIAAWAALPQLQEFLRHMLGWPTPGWVMHWT